MKELSIKQKAKRYDEAIERATKWYDANTNEGYRGIFEEIFPELKESEDESIRKGLIKFVSAVIRGNDDAELSGVLAKDCLAWLEKQKSVEQHVQEAQPIEWSEEDEYYRGIIMYCLNNEPVRVADKKNAISWFKSLNPKSQWKPSDEHYELEEFAKIVRDNLTGISKAVQQLFEAKYLQLTGNKMYGGFKD